MMYTGTDAGWREKAGLALAGGKTRGLGAIFIYARE